MHHSRLVILTLLLMPFMALLPRSANATAMGPNDPTVYLPQNLNCSATLPACAPGDCLCQDKQRQCGAMDQSNNQATAKQLAASSIPPPSVPNTCLQAINGALGSFNMNLGINALLMPLIEQMIMGYVQSQCNQVAGTIGGVKNVMSNINLVCMPSFGNLSQLSLGLPSFQSCDGLPVAQFNAPQQPPPPNTNMNTMLNKFFGKSQ